MRGCGGKMYHFALRQKILIGNCDIYGSKPWSEFQIHGLLEKTYYEQYNYK